MRRSSASWKRGGALTRNCSGNRFPAPFPIPHHSAFFILPSAFTCGLVGEARMENEEFAQPEWFTDFHCWSIYARNDFEPTCHPRAGVCMTPFPFLQAARRPPPGVLLANQ